MENGGEDRSINPHGHYYTNATILQNTETESIIFSCPKTQWNAQISTLGLNFENFLEKIAKTSILSKRDTTPHARISCINTVKICSRKGEHVTTATPLATNVEG